MSPAPQHQPAVHEGGGWGGAPDEVQGTHHELCRLVGVKRAAARRLLRALHQADAAEEAGGGVGLGGGAHAGGHRRQALEQRQQLAVAVGKRVQLAEERRQDDLARGMGARGE